ncbi:MAG TPA: hypothetical protein VKK79_12325 [Candidatus Lokiarchaeia archaeon]|nr:hypothetical protein [Candidatus Lokiarchaeia archaeon]
MEDEPDQIEKQLNRVLDFTLSEDIILIIDSGSSAYMEDIPPNRMAVIASAVNAFADLRLEADMRDRYFLIEAGDNVIEWSYDMVDDPKQVAQRIAQLVSQPSLVSPEPKIVQAFGKALERHIKTFKTVGQKTLRVFIVGGGNVAPADQNLVDMARKVAARIGVIVDTIKLGVEYPPHLFKAVAEITRGTYQMASSAEDLYVAFQALSSKKEVLKPTYIATKEPPKKKTFLEILAADMKPLSEEASKCQICFNIEPADVLRECPNCKKVLHLSCAGQWAENQNLGFPTVFRCPFCFFLLKVPRNFVDFSKFVQKFEETKQEYQEAHASPQMDEAEEKPQITSLFEEEMALNARREEILQWLQQKMPDSKRFKLEPIVEEILKAEKENDLESCLNFLGQSRNIDTSDFPAVN